ncbi:MAG: SPASM domain-containing protein [Desulfamplus sp.]|nr:SPASM domain-containing protein [Desulfamplus sp.]
MNTDTVSTYRFLCHWFNEIVILSDGNVTTCCQDAKGENVYANIYKHPFKEIKRRFSDYRKRLISDPTCLPRCSACFDRYRKELKGVATFNVQLDATEKQIEAYLQNSEFKSGYLVIEPTVHCTLKCCGCIHSMTDMTQFRDYGFLDLDALYSWVTPYLSHIKNIRYFNYGETFIHPKAIEFCADIKKANPEISLIIATNGMPLHSSKKRQQLIASNVDAIYFSIHGSCQESVSQYMTDKFNFDKMMYILADLAEIRKAKGVTKPELVWKYLLFQWNDTDAHIRRAKELACQVGVDSILFTLTNAPSPSKRFTPHSNDWKELTKGLSFLWDFAASWKCHP